MTGKGDDRIVYIVHCVDTEGPLYESLEATFERVEEVFGLYIAPSSENLDRLRHGEGLPEHLRSVVSDFVSPDRLNYNSDWSMIDGMVNEILSEEWRRRYVDDFGNGYIFSWFVVDHIGFVDNPRRKALGYNTIFNYYREKLRQSGSRQDEVHWHFHPVSFFHEALKTSNNFSHTNEHLQVLSRRVIDHGWFPAVFRPGLHVERPDISLFLEQWIPFDYGNQGVEEEKERITSLQKDVAAGRYGDWRRATTEWEVYHPDFYDYQLKGAMKRYVARCLNLNARIRAIDEHEVEKAFRRADGKKRTILAVTNHDEREMRPYIDWFNRLVRKVAERYPAVRIKNAGALEAVREALRLKKEEPLKFDVTIEDGLMTVKTDKPCFGPQPYFCFKSRNRHYIHENLDYHGGTHWSYTFGVDTILLDQLDAIGLAANDSYGNTTVWRKIL